MDPKHRALPYYLGISFCAVLSLGGSCDHTRIEAAIEPRAVRAKTGDSVPLELVVADAVSSRTVREYWVVEPESLGKVVKADSARRATFHAEAPGQGKITAFAYCRPQTSPQEVAEIEVAVEGEVGATLPRPDVPFCDRFSKALVGCWCSGERARIAETASAVPNEAAAVALVRDRLEAIAAASTTETAPAARLDDAPLRCSEVAVGFFNCFAGTGYVATVSAHGEIYRTECGV